MLMKGNDCETLRHPLSLGEAFFNSKWIEQYGIEPIIKGLATQKQELINAQIVNSLRNSLFNTPRLPFAIGLDLAAINIQRGRDHGMPDYNTVRAHFTGKRAINFSMLAEDHFRGGNVGITIHAILKEQFERVRDGDFYYFENDPFLSRSDLRTIKQTRLSTIIENNTPYRVQKNVFRVTDTKCNDTKTTAGNGNGNGNGKNPPNNSSNSETHCQLNIEVGNNSLTITPSATSAPYFQIFSSSWKSIYLCMQSCAQTHVIDNLKPGNYRIVTYDQNRRVTCTKKIKISGRKKSHTDNSSALRNAPISAASKVIAGSNLFPNPAKQIAYLKLADYIGHQATIHVYNSFGQVVRQVPSFAITEPFITLPVQELTAGIYQVQIVLDQEIVKTHKMIIQQ